MSAETKKLCVECCGTFIRKTKYTCGNETQRLPTMNGVGESRTSASMRGHRGT